MFEVYFTVGKEVICDAIMQWIPRKGEQIRLGEDIYEVINIVYVIKEGTFKTTMIVVMLKGI